MRFLKAKVQKKNKTSFSRIEKIFGVFLDEANHSRTTLPGVSEKSAPSQFLLSNKEKKLGGFKKMVATKFVNVKNNCKRNKNKNK
jgi:hypothetical protein